MILYLDSSAWVKIYLEEPGTDDVARLIERAEGVGASLIAYPEIRSALSRRLREGKLTLSGHGQVLSSFNEDWTGVFTIPPDAALCRRAGDLAHKHSIRGIDAVHLASALVLRAGAGRRVPVFFLTYDGRLSRAARREKFEVN